MNAGKEVGYAETDLNGPQTPGKIFIHAIN